MPTINGTTLTLTTVNNDVTIRVQYNAVFSELERFLAANGLTFAESIQVIGQDPGTVNDQTLQSFPKPIGGIPVPAGAGSVTVPRDRSILVSRGSLQEDPAVGDADEINCSIEITPDGFPVPITAFTPQQTLLG
jgi:hypothetical protein